jgi:hypothetical protein
MTDKGPNNSVKIFFRESVILAEPDNAVVDPSGHIQPIKCEITAIVFPNKSDNQIPLGSEIVARHTYGPRVW